MIELNKKMLKVNTQKRKLEEARKPFLSSTFFALFCFSYMDELDWPVADCSGRDIHCCYLLLRSVIKQECTKMRAAGAARIPSGFHLRTLLLTYWQFVRQRFYCFLNERPMQSKAMFSLRPLDSSLPYGKPQLIS